MNRKHEDNLRARLDAALRGGDAPSGQEHVLRETFWRPSPRAGLASIVPIRR